MISWYLADGRFDLRRAVVQRSIADLQTLGLVEPVDGAADVTHGQGTPRQPQQLSLSVRWPARSARLAGPGPAAGVDRPRSAAPAGPASCRPPGLRRRGPSRGRRTGRPAASAFGVAPGGGYPWPGGPLSPLLALRICSRAWRAFRGVSSMVIGEYSTFNDSAWEINMSAVGRSFSLIAWRARRSRSAACCRLSSGGELVPSAWATPAAPTRMASPPPAGPAKTRLAEKHRTTANHPHSTLAVAFNTILLCFQTLSAVARRTFGQTAMTSLVTRSKRCLREGAVKYLENSHRSRAILRDSAFCDENPRPPGPADGLGACALGKKRKTGQLAE